MSPDNLRSLVSPSDIADLAGVSRAAVSNWRKRATNFPPAAGGSATNPLFALDAVLAWLAERGVEVRVDQAGASLWAAVNTTRGALDTEEAGHLVLGLACLRKRLPAVWAEAMHGTGDRQHDAWLLGASEDLASAGLLNPGVLQASLRLPQETLGHLISAVNRIETEHLADAVDFVLERGARSLGRAGGEHGYIGSRTAAMLAALTLAHGGNVIYDPACGVGAALMAAGSAAGSRRVRGEELDPGSATVARQRGFLRDLDYEITTSDALAHDQFPKLRSDVVLLEPPFGVRITSPELLTDPRFEFGPPSQGTSEFAWIQHAIAHLAEGGRAYVITPSTPLFADSGRHVRSELLRRGCVEAVAALPPRMLVHTSIPLALWVLRRPVGQAKDVLLIDASNEVTPETRVEHWLSDIDTLKNVPHTHAEITSLLRMEAVLTPQRWIARAQREDLAGAFAATRVSILKSVEDLQATVEAMQPPQIHATPRLLTVGDLVEQGVIELRAGRGRSEEAELDDELRPPVVVPRHIHDGGLPDTQVTNLKAVDPLDVTRPGDVLLTTWGEISAVIDDDGGHLLANGVYRLRVVGEVLSSEYLAAMLPGSWNQVLHVGSTAQRAHPKALEVPLVPLEQQERYVVNHIGARVIKLRAEVLTFEAQRTTDLLRDALRYGVNLSRNPSTGGEA